MSNPAVSLFGQHETIINHGELIAMGRRRYQRPSVKQTETQSKSSRRWYFEARVDVLLGDGKTVRRQQQFYLGNVSEMGRREAEKRRDEILAEKINRPDIVIPTQVKFGFVLDKWLATVDVRDSTYQGYESMVRKHLRPRWGEVSVRDITPMDVESWLIAKARTCSEKTLRNIRSRFTEAWNRAIFYRFTRDVCPVVGMQNIVRFGSPPRAKTLPTLEQFHRFLYLLDEPYRSIVVICAFTGLRVSEAMALTVEQLNSDTTEIIEAVSQRTGRRIGPVKAEHSKRTIPVSHLRGDIAIPADALQSDRPFNVGYHSVYGAIKEAARNTGIDYRGFGCHTFRRMHNTMFRRIAGGGEEATGLAMNQLGHADAKTNDIYYVEGVEDVKRRAEIAFVMRRNVMEVIN